MKEEDQIEAFGLDDMKGAGLFFLFSVAPLILAFAGAALFPGISALAAVKSVAFAQSAIAAAGCLMMFAARNVKTTIVVLGFSMAAMISWGAAGQLEKNKPDYAAEERLNDLATEEILQNRAMEKMRGEAQRTAS